MERKKVPPGGSRGAEIQTDEVFEHFKVPGFLRESATYGVWENTEAGLARIKGLAEVLAKSRKRYQAVTIFRDAQYPVVLAVMREDGESLTQFNTICVEVGVDEKDRVAIYRTNDNPCEKRVELSRDEAVYLANTLLSLTQST